MKKAYVTVISDGDGYVPGVEVVGRSLQAAGCREPKLVLATRDVSDGARKQLAREGWEVRQVDPIDNPAADHLLFPRFASVFVKLRAWALTDLDRVVLLDADTLVLKNIDSLFERRTFAAAPDFFMPDRFNSGVMVLDPSADTFEAMLRALRVAGSYDGGDQGFLNSFFSDWYAMDAEHRLPVGYNMAHFIYQFMRAHPTLQTALEREVKVVHYMVQKPWKVRTMLTGGSEAWWKTYFETHPESSKRWKEEAHALEDWAFDHMASLVVR